MGMDIGLDDPRSLEQLTQALAIVNSGVDAVHDDVENHYSEGSEVYRLTRALPPGPISFDRTVFVAAESARGALDQISSIFQANTPTKMNVLQVMLRTALVGAGRIVFALMPTNPETRLENARVLIAQEASGFTKALDEYAKFQQFDALRPETDYVDRARSQKVAIQQGSRPPGDARVLHGAAGELATALAEISEYPDQDRQTLAENITWSWNALSGLAHTHAWPRLLPGFGQDRRSPGDFAGDFHMIATTTHVAVLSLHHRLQPGSANTTTPVPLN